MGWWLGLFVSREGSASCRFKDAFSIFKILTGCSLINKSAAVYKARDIFPFAVFVLGGRMFEGSACFGFLGNQSCQASLLRSQALKCQ